MWKPSKKLVTWILVILLIYNILTLAITSTVVIFMSGASVAPRMPSYILDENGELYMWYSEENDTWWIKEMNKVDNNPRLIAATRYILDTTVAGVGPESMYKLSHSNEIQFYGTRFERIGNSIKIVDAGETLEKGEETNFHRWDLLKNFVIPWWREKTPLYAKNEGRYENFTTMTVTVRWENLDFVLIEVWEGASTIELSPWGPIHFIIVLGALIYVKKRWH